MRIIEMLVGLFIPFIREDLIDSFTKIVGHGMSIFTLFLFIEKFSWVSGGFIVPVYIVIFVILLMPSYLVVGVCFFITELLMNPFQREKFLKSFLKKKKKEFPQYKEEVEALSNEERELLHINRILSKPYKETLKESFFYKRDLDLIRDYDFVKTKADKIFETLLQWPGFHSNNEIFFVRSVADYLEYFYKEFGDYKIQNVLYTNAELISNKSLKTKNREKKNQYPFLKKYNNCGIKILSMEKRLSFIYMSTVRRISKHQNYYESITFPIEQKKELTEEQAMKILEENADWIMEVKGAKKKFKGNVYAYNSYIK